MKTLRLILGDQLSLNITALHGLNTQNDLVLMAEVKEEATYVKHHKKKIAFLFSAMRHFAAELVEKNVAVDYVGYHDSHNKGCLFEQVKYCCNANNIEQVIVTHPGEYRLYNDMQTWSERLNIAVDIKHDNRFIAEKSYFAEWAKDRKQFRMEYFYRELRKKEYILMDHDQPTGGKWNYDAQNREPLPKFTDIPKPTQFRPDNVTREVIALVNDTFAEHFGHLDTFHYAVTRKQALQVLTQFIDDRLVDFGKYQDAMAHDEPWLFHSHISLYINCGLLHPTEVIEQAEQAFKKGKAPINAVEGFIRQILGWREFVRGFYWYFMPDYKHHNHLNAQRELPDLFWSANTDMNCLSQSVKDTQQNAYAHHIQRLMVIGNFALLTGLDPKYVNEWFLIVYADAYEWVEMPNVSGMALFADGGILASKPYAASGSYINKMSNYCEHCVYNVKEKTGHQACPFNYLYWHFLWRHKHQLERNPRMRMIYSTMNKMDEKKLGFMLEDAEQFLTKIDNNEKI